MFGATAREACPWLMPYALTVKMPLGAVFGADRRRVRRRMRRVPNQRPGEVRDPVQHSSAMSFADTLRAVVSQATGSL
jgi:hypothetical protein